MWYNIYLPTRYYIYGTSITAEFTLCPLNKGITIGKIKMEVLERVTLSTESGRFKTRQSDQIVAVHEQDMPENSLVPLTEEQTGIADESYHFKISIPLERSLVKARQSLETEHIKIWHNLKIYVNLHNPDGHISQLLVRNLLHIFISPNLPVGEDQCVSASSEHLANASAAHEGVLEAPPTYGLHQLDQLYDDIDTGAFMSGVATPFNPSTLSRTGSQDSLQAATDSSQTSNQSSGASSPSVSQLQSRLTALQERPSGIDNDLTLPESASALACALARALPRNDSSGSFIHPSGRSTPSTSLRALAHTQHHSSTQRSPCHSPPRSHASPAASPPLAYDMAALARIPSYNTAVRAPLSRTPPSRELLPSYHDATASGARRTGRASEGGGEGAAVGAARAVVAGAG